MQTVKDFINVSERNPFSQAEIDDSLVKVFEKLLPLKARRVAIMEKGGPNIAGMVSGFDAVCFFQREMIKKGFFVNTLFSDIISKAVTDSRDGKKILSIKESSTTMDSFTFLTENSISGCAVLDDDGVLVSVLSASDFLRMKRDCIAHEWDTFFDDLKEPIKDYLSHRNFYFPGQYSKKPITIDMKTDTVMDVLSKYISNHIHRLFEINEKGHPIAVWSLSDIVNVFLNYEKK